MDSYGPQPWLSPPPDGNQRPLSIQTNVVLPADADQQDRGVLMKNAQDIINHSSPQIDRFIANARAQSAMSGRSYGDLSSSLDHLKLRWRLNHGLERLDLDVYPTTSGGEGAQKSEVNLDGYLCFIHAEPFYPDYISVDGVRRSQSPGPFAILVNGYVIESAYTPVLSPEAPVGGYPILFGKTALLSGSNSDARNPLLSTQSIAKPNKVIPPDGWGQIKTVAMPDGTPGDKLPLTLGYWIFDWLNENNPFQYVNTSSSFGQATGEKWQTAFPPATKPTFNRGCFFADPKNSPLNPKGKNGACVIPAGGGLIAADILCYMMILGEFYDRGAFRVVSQSWTIGKSPNQSIKINDSPLSYGQSVLYNTDSEFEFACGIDLNLDPAYTKLGPTGDDSFMGARGPVFEDNVGTGTYTNGMTPAQIAAIAAWQAECNAIVESFSATQAPLLTAALAAINMYDDNVIVAHETAFQVRTIEGDATLFSNFWPNDVHNFYTAGGVVQSRAGGPVPYDPVGNRIVQTAIIVSAFDDDLNSFVYGPNQEYYVALPTSDDEINYLINAYNGGLASPPYIEPQYQVTLVSDTTAPDGTQTIVNNITAIPYPFLSNAPPAGSPFPAFWGPGKQPDLADQMAGVITTVMTHAAALLATYDDLLLQKPPALPPFPQVNNSIQNFPHSFIAINDDTWSWNQNP